jgi:MFS family permease
MDGTAVAVNGTASDGVARIDVMPEGPAPGVSDPEVGARPTTLLPVSHLLRISAYWLGLTAIDAGVGQFNTNRLEFDGFVPKDDVGTAMFLIGLGVAAVSIVVQPTVGYVSDYWVSRWGRRKPFIVVGSLLDLVFLAGIATASDVVALAAFVILLQLSTNTARGPFQGYVPDLVAEPQVGMASGLVGLMQIIGNVIGFGLVSLAVGFHNMPAALLAIAAVELVAMVSVVLRVGKGLPPRPRRGKSWGTIAREAWATDILRERSYVWLLVSRLLFLGGGALLANFVLIFLGRALGLAQDEANRTQILVLVAVVAANLIAVIPASRISDRIGRKPVIWLACGIGGVGIAIAAVAPSVSVALVGGFLFGASAGAFLAVDWALMTDIIPRASAGRYMGLSNVATASATTLGLAVGGVVLDLVTRAGFYELSPRAVFALGVVFYAAAALTLRPVVEPRADRHPTGGAGMAAA